MDLPSEQNTGFYQKTGNDELIANFFVGGDGTVLSSMECAARVVGYHRKKKHEKNNNDSRMSIIMHHSGSVAASNVSTSFLLSGKPKREEFSDDFLLNHGAAHRSTIAMIE